MTSDSDTRYNIVNRVHLALCALVVLESAIAEGPKTLDCAEAAEDILDQAYAKYLAEKKQSLQLRR